MSLKTWVKHKYVILLAYIVQINELLCYCRRTCAYLNTDLHINA